MFDGKAFGAEIVGIVQDYVERQLEPIKAENETLRARVAELEARPTPEKGEAGERGADGENGKDADPEAVRQIVAEEVAKAVAEIPPAEKGEKGDTGERGEKGEPGADGKDGADGRGVADIMRDHEGNIVFSFDDGRMKSVGKIDGRDGKDGQPGKDGRDGFGLDDFDIDVIDERTIELKFARGDTSHVFELVFPVIIDQGVYKAGTEYKRGDAVTWGGSLWIAQRDTKAKPDGPDSGWRLAVKKGRDGKDGKNG